MEKVRGMLGVDNGDLKEITLLGRIIRWTPEGVEYEADPRHRRMVTEYFGLGEGSKEALRVNGEKEEEEQPGDEIELEAKEAKEFRAVAVRVDYLNLDCPDLQFPIKQSSRAMAKPVRGSWRKLKRVARYMLGIAAVVWVFAWQEEPEHSHTLADSDWEGNVKDRKSTSGGVWMLGEHRIKPGAPLKGLMP